MIFAECLRTARLFCFSLSCVMMMSRAAHPHTQLRTNINGHINTDTLFQREPFQSPCNEDFRKSKTVIY